jgi:thiamine pyrophosphate-dependent acetolactate synthase large subunit-like protein
MELDTLCRYRLPITVIVLNDGADARHERVIEAFGGTGHRIAGPNELERALRSALSAGAPVLIDCVLEPGSGTGTGTEADASTNISANSVVKTIAPIWPGPAGDVPSPAPAPA